MKSDSFALRGKEAKAIILDFAECRKIDDINLILSKKFSLPDGISADWVKMWDYLEKSFCRLSAVRVELHGFFKVPEELRKKCRFLIEILENLQCSSENFSYDFVF